jgi:hypothetical protein
MDFPQTKPVTEQQGSIRWDRERNLTVREIDRLVQFLHGCRAASREMVVKVPTYLIIQ